MSKELKSAQTNNNSNDVHMNSHEYRTSDLYAGYDSKTILQNVNITIPEGKVSVILGSNGCGKSTLLKTMARLISPSKGAVLLDGKAITSYPSKQLAKTIGLLPQSPLVPDGITVSDLVSRGRFPYQPLLGGLTEDDYRIIAESIETLGITEIADRNVDELSGGQRQRVWIAMALAQQTEILLLDEPTTYLDVAYQIDILEKLKELNKARNITIVMVLHDINLSARYADHIFAMKKGQLVCEGSPHDVITKENIHAIYSMDSEIIEDPVYHTPMVVPIGHLRR